MAEHAGTTNADILKRFSQKVAVSSTKERIDVLNDVAAIAAAPEFPENAVRGIFKYLAPTISRYHDNRSRHAVLNVIRAVTKSHPESTVKTLSSTLESHANFHKKQLHSCKSTSGEALFALTWTCVVMQETFLKGNLSRDSFKQLVGVQCGLVYGALASGSKVISFSAYRKLVSIFRSSDKAVEEYAQLLTEIEASMFVLSSAGILISYLTKTKDQELLKKFKGPFLDLYTKQVLGSRTKPSVQLLISCNNLLRHCTHQEFQDSLMPATKKAMLRNPESILQAVGYLIIGQSLDLRQYAQELAKPLGVQICSKDPATRAEAVTAFKNLAVQCSDTEAVEKLVCHLFDILNGSEGKLTSADQRISVLQAVGNASHCTASGVYALQSLSNTVTEKFIPMLQQEVHEGTLVHALSMMSLWCAKFYTSVPDKLIEWFKKGVTLKSSTSNVRNAYLQCMNTAFHGDTLPQATAIVPLLIQTIEKANSQSSQIQLLTEAVSAACILAKISLIDIQAESKLGPFWATVLDSQKQLYLNDRYLQQASEEALPSLIALSEKLILEYPQKMTEKASKPYYKAIVHCLVHKSWEVRKATAASVKRLLGQLGGTAISLALLDQFKVFLSNHKFIDPDTLDMEKENFDPNKYVSPTRVARALITLVGVEKVDPKDAEAIAMATILSSHHPSIVYANESAWTDILYYIKLDARNFISKNLDSLLAMVRIGEALDKSAKAALSTMVRIAPDLVLPPLLEYLRGILCQSELMTITVEEYETFLCPEGELYNKALLASFEKSETKETNIKRENKLYSYKEQMAEIELRKELEKKKGKTEKPPLKLTKKQEEQLQACMQKESEIRKRLAKFDSVVCCGCDILEASIYGNQSAVRDYMKELLGCLTPLFVSPLAAPQITKAFIQLGISSFDDKLLGTQVCNSTVRLLDPACKVEPEWTKEPAQDQAARLVKKLYTIASKEITEFEDTSLFPVATFTVIFYLLKAVLKQGAALVKGDDRTQGEAIKLIELHARMRTEDHSDEHDPALLDHKELLCLLIHVISTSIAKVGQSASSALVEVCDSISGKEGCSKATEKEILVLLEALKSPCVAVRDSTLQGLMCLVDVLPNVDDNFDLGIAIAQRLWVASFDSDDNVKMLGEKILQELMLDEPYEDMAGPLIDDVISSEEVVRLAASKALEKTLECHSDYVTATIEQLKTKYEDKLYMPPPKLDNFGRLVEDQPQDEWQARSGVAAALKAMSPLLPSDQIIELFSFYVPKALGDRIPEVRSHMRDAALAAINDHGKANVVLLLPVFEEFLANAPNTASNDAVRQSIVILMGSLAKHLDKDNPKIKPIMAQLIGALSTPSQEVQEAVAHCLPPLVQGIRQDAPELVQKLMQLLLESDKYGERRGAAYGLAGLVRGLGITSLKQLEIMSTLEEAVKDKKNPRRREGALFAYEMLCAMLGKLFEPYVVNILPHLLLCFGDSNQYVREAADFTAKAVMKMLTAHGVKLVLPSLLRGLEEDAWRTKAGAVELLGAMAYCAPKQLSACLPSIVPKLSEVLTDSHVKVQKAGAQALRQIGAVIRNPEIQEIVPNLLDALQEPSKKTMVCLQTLLDTKFVHFIDAPSLALIMPVVERAFQDRNTETRKMAAQIIGNMYSLTDQKDLDPYIEKVIPGLQQSLLDPVPEVRTVSSRALGAMVKGMGGSKFDELLKWLMDTLKSESSSVDRSGAAQGLSEVIGGLGLAELKRLMPGIIQTAERTDIPSHARDGYIMMYIYLPSVFGKEFMAYIGPIIPSILQALADESEYVRDTALRAGQRIINVYADTAIELLLPQLEKGLFDDNWRIRFSSVQLLGDLLYRISGVTGKMTTETAHDDDNFGTESSSKAIMRALGKERRDRVLAGLYMGRSDTAILVRQSALHVWKIIVSHTPQTLREILPVLFTLLLGCLASTSHDKRQVAARTLGDLVKKLGERVLPEIIPILERGLGSERADQRQGVCIGLTEIMASTSREHVLVYADSLIPTVRRALVDPLGEVREAAAHTFDSLHSNIGPRALDEILPDLLNKLRDPDLSDEALDGLQQVMTVKSRVVMPYLVPQLVTPPVNTQALSLLSSVAGDSLTKHLPKILPALMDTLSEKAGTPDEAQELEYCRSVVLSVQDDRGVRTIMEELLAAIKNPSPDLCCAAVVILQAFCDKTQTDYSDYRTDLFRGLIASFVRKESKVLLASWECLNTVTKKLDVSEMLQHIQDIRSAIKLAASELKGAKELPGFSIPKKGIAPVLPIFREGMLNGSQDVKAVAANGLGELIHLTSPEALKPSVVNITGPLIRILGDRFSAQVKVAVLETLTLLLAKVGLQLKPFLPQLQTTFLKALNDPQRAVRLKAASALGRLIVIHVRVDPLFTELHSGIRNTSDSSVKDTMLQALRFCVSGAGQKMAEPLRKQITATLLELLGSQEDATRAVAAGCLGALCTALSEAELKDTLIQHLLDADPSQDWMLRQGRSMALGVALKEVPSKLTGTGLERSIEDYITELATSDRIPLCISGYRCMGFLLNYQLSSSDGSVPSLVLTLIKGLKNDSNDVKQLVTQVISFLIHNLQGKQSLELVRYLTAPLVMGAKEKNTSVRSNSEYALVSLLKLRQGDTFLNETLQQLDAGMRESLSELVTKTLLKLSKQVEPPPDNIDDTVLK
ncbi:stalled ribosome sensor GCN1-like [Ylistrum balloti]|uniref:stalled ribosome sensor GCN1-like n=1 Tax=Ylistrum balloti TaxID=509963 RepID=UPI002905F076|nr:stalled ribosome sensor GCN1-like [Ylistrum balloti]